MRGRDVPERRRTAVVHDTDFQLIARIIELRQCIEAAAQLFRAIARRHDDGNERHAMTSVRHATAASRTSMPTAMGTTNATLFGAAATIANEIAVIAAARNTVA